METKSIKDRSIELIVELTAVCDNIKGRSIFTNQLLRACSSIGANYYEAQYAQSPADFIHKLELSLKECHETEYWIEILYRIDVFSEEQYRSYFEKCGTIRRMFIASINTAKKKSQ